MWGTTFVNCICEAIIEVLEFHFCVYCHKHGSPPGTGLFVSQSDEDFFKQVSLINFGDDNLKYVHRSAREYYQHHYIMMFSQWIQMGITPAFKEEKVIKFKKVTEILFLKRTPVWDPNLNCLLGTLTHQSIARMFAFTDSSSPDWEKMVILQGLREMSFHLPILYCNFVRIFEDIIAKYVNLSSCNQSMLRESIIKSIDWISFMGENLLPLGNEFDTFTIPVEDILTVSTSQSSQAVSGLSTKLADKLNMSASDIFVYQV